MKRLSVTFTGLWSRPSRTTDEFGERGDETVETQLSVCELLGHVFKVLTSGYDAAWTGVCEDVSSWKSTRTVSEIE